MNAVDAVLQYDTGERVRVRRWGSSATETALDVLILPGRGDPLEKYDAFARQAVARGGAVVAFDWFGQGRSSRDDVPTGALHVDTFDRYHRDLQLVLADLASERPRLVVAYSMGGLIALRALVDGTLRADRLALISPMLRFRDSAPEPVTRILATLAVWLGHGRRFAAGERWTPPDECTLETNMAVDEPEAFARLSEIRRSHAEGLVTGSTWAWARAATREMGAVRRLPLETPTTPTTIFSSPDDRSVDPREHATLAARLPHAELIELGGRHDLLAEGWRTGAAVEAHLLDHVRALGPHP